MANIPLKSIKFPNLADTYTVPSNAGELPYNKNATYPADTVGKALQDKPDADGTIANAEQLHSTVGVTDTEPFSFRTSGGSLNIGDREELTLVGVDVGWNQLINGLASSSTVGGVTITNNGDGSFTLNGTATSDGNYDVDSRGYIGLYVNHIYYMGGFKRPSGGSSYYGLGGLVIDTGNGGVWKNPSYLSLHPRIDIRTGDVFNNVKIYPVCIDLTALFGSTIADYIYTLEQSTAGSGVAFFNKYFGTGYKAYDSGSLQSPVVKGIKMTGFNQWDEEWESGYIDDNGQNAGSSGAIRSKNFIKVLPNTSYCITAPSATYLRFYDADKNFIAKWDKDGRGNGGTPFSIRTTQDNCYYMRFYIDGNTYGNNVCINLHWDGERDGEYEAYKEYTYDITPETLHGVMTIEDGKLKAVGDVRRADGTIDRRYGNLVLNGSNSEDWTYNTSAGSTTLFTLTLADALNLPNNWDTDIRCAGTRFAPTTSSALVGDMSVPWKMALISSKRVMFSIPSTEASIVADMRTWLSTHNVELIYEKQTPTTETADPFTTPMVVDDWGTEEFKYADGTTKFVPVGHSTKYLPNLKAKLEMSPDSPNGDGVYVVEQSGGINTYIPLASADTITSIITRLEALENA